MIANPTTMPKWIQCGPWTVAEMVEAIRSRYETLDPRRRYMFIEWLHAHSDQVKTARTVNEGLAAWFESMRCENLQGEYRLIMDEIDWWGSLDECSLSKIMLAELARNAA